MESSFGSTAVARDDAAIIGVVGGACRAVHEGSRWAGGCRPPRPVPARHPSPERIAAQQLPGWVWDILEDRWRQGLRLLTAYTQRTGAPNTDAFYLEEAEDNFTLGAWVDRSSNARRFASVWNPRRTSHPLARARSMVAPITC